MRHRKSRYKLNRFTSWRKATLLSLARSLLIHQSIRTTLHKAKSAVPLIEKLINLAKANTLAAKRQAFKLLCDHKLVSLLFSDIGTRFQSRTSGYTRIMHLDNRRGDNAQLVVWELTEIKKKEKKKPKKEKEERPAEKPETKPQIQERPVEETKPKPTKRFLGGIRNIFKKKERDFLKGKRD